MSALSAQAQMKLTFNNLTGVATNKLSTGATLVQFPVGTNLSTVLQQAQITVDGKSVAASNIVPNPAQLQLTEGSQVVLSYQGKAYEFKFTVGKYFTAVIMSDPHIEQTNHNGTTVKDMRAYVEQIVNMGKAGGMSCSFDALPGYRPHCDIAFSLGDMDADSKQDDNQFAYAHNGFNQAGIPFITMMGNHDCVPDYWTGTKGDAGLTFGIKGGSNANDAARKTVESYCDTAQMHGVANLETITDGSSHTHIAPFTFTFNDVRFYCGQTYWFQKPYDKPGFLTSAKYYAPDGDIDALQTFVEKHTSEPSVWMQHYPFVAGSDCDRWWLDQSDVGRYIKTQDTSAYGTSDDVAVYTSSSAQAVAKKKKDMLAGIIKLTTNPVHFSGHTHTYSQNTYNGITDYTVAAPGSDAGAAYVVLMKAGKGVVEVKQAHFNSTVSSGVDSLASAEFTASAANADSAAAMKLRTALARLGISTTGTVDALNQRFATYYNSHAADGKLDVTTLLGDNTDFNTTQGDAISGNANVHVQPGWNLHVATFSNITNSSYIYLQQNTSGTGLYMRARWQDRVATEQILKQVALPVGKFTLSFSAKLTGSLTTSKCYYEVGGTRNAITPNVNGSTQSVSFFVSKPSLFTLSFGFDGGQGGTESALNIDNISLVCTGAETLKAGDDVTSMITNADFSGGYSGAASGSRVQIPTGWTFTYTFSGWNDTFVDATNHLFNAWAGAITRAELMQTLNNLPNGAYRLSADVKTDVTDGTSCVALYGSADGSVSRSEEATGSNFTNYQCAFNVQGGKATIGIRSDKAYYQIKNIKLTYIGTAAEAETAAGYLRQDYYWNGKDKQEYTATAASYSAATGVVVYPRVKNQLIYAASTSQFARTQNVVVNGTCQKLVLTDGEPFSTTQNFTAVEAEFSRQFTNGTYSTVCLPFALSGVSGTLYTLTAENGTSLSFTSTAELAANTPAVFVPSADTQLTAQNVNVTATPKSMSSTATTSGYQLVGVYASTTVNNIYGFNTDGQFLTAQSTVMPPFRAYIQVPASEQGKLLKAIYDNSTGISSISSVKARSSRRYNLQGQRVNKFYKGVVIQNGKKIWIKD